MTCVLALVVVACAALDVRAARPWNPKKAAVLLREEPENPKCFAEGRKDLTCFWEEDEERAGPLDQYSFTYAYQKESSCRCPLTMLPSPGGKRLLVCHLNQTQMFVKMDIRIQRQGVLIHNRSLLVELLLLPDPPVNLTLTRTQQQGQLMARWLPPPLKYMEDSMVYQVEFARDGSHVGQVEKVLATSELVLRGLLPGTKYKVRVRVKMDGVSYDGFWSEWSEPVLMDTPPAEVDPLIVSLTVTILLIFTVLSLIVFMSYRRYLTRKIWPNIPTPENKFQDLFTVYGGDFQAWMGHRDGPLWLGPLVLSEEHLSALEVLSELGPALCSPPLPVKTSRPVRGSVTEEKVEDGGQLEPRDSAEGWNSHSRATRQRPLPCPHSPPPELQDAYISLSTPKRGEEDQPEEAVPLEVLLGSRKGTRSESHSDLGSAPQSSGSGRLSYQSSFESPGHGWAHRGSGYAYMAVADSGVSMDYSPMSRPDDLAKVLYANDVPAHRKHFLSSHDEC